MTVLQLVIQLTVHVVMVLYFILLACRGMNMRWPATTLFMVAGLIWLAAIFNIGVEVGAQVMR